MFRPITAAPSKVLTRVVAMSPTTTPSFRPITIASLSPARATVEVVATSPPTSSAARPVATVVTSTLSSSECTQPTIASVVGKTLDDKQQWENKMNAIKLEREQMMLRKEELACQREEVALNREKDQAAVWAFIRERMEETGEVPDPLKLPSNDSSNDHDYSYK